MQITALKKLSSNGIFIPSKIFIFSFYSNKTLLPFIKILEKNNFGEYTKCKNDKNYDYRRFIVIDGSVDLKDRSYLTNVFNDTNNVYGKECLIVLASSVIAQGYSFFCLRHIYIMEPHWNMSLIDQIIGRGNRLNSHK